MPPLPRVAPVLNKRGGSSGDLHGNTKTNPKTWGALEAKSAGITAALFYGFMSVASVFLNKAIFEVWKYRYPASLVAGQTIFTVCAIATLTKINVIRIGKFNYAHFRRVFPVAAVFQLKLVLDMSALVLVNIPMYGVLKSSTTPFVMLLDYALRSRVPASRVQMAVWLTTMGGFVAGCGDFTFDPLGYALALASAMCTACYVVLVGKIGDELQLDSFTLLLYNSLWSTPLSLALMVVTGEFTGVTAYPHMGEKAFLLAFATSCGSAFILNYATYVCTQINDALTTSVVGRTKSVVQGVGGLFAFKVKTGVVNISGLLLNSLGICWYAYERYVDERRRNNVRRGVTKLGQMNHVSDSFITRNESQLTLSPKVVRHDNDAVGPSAGSLERRNQDGGGAGVGGQNGGHFAVVVDGGKSAGGSPYR
jgi:solute carrier family 35 protein|tara:strand:+ start:362 stop:1627 length:1266 start_codon:yes stop_codon:yes gene_type:complete|mmetsp:Transcript_11597/g.41718  ORF Transcript_11597/g.41718 Transcript_11597/m.41718 type:complete len:422 (-) Transcript_11597:133-1398(-)